MAVAKVGDPRVQSNSLLEDTIVSTLARILGSTADLG